MNLLLDIGNSRIKWALAAKRRWQPGEAMPRADKAFKDLARPIWKDLEAPERVLVCSVADADYNKSVHTWVKRRWKIDAEFFHSEPDCCGVVNAYQDPSRLGADRWACLVAAHALYTAPVCVVDCGTAITIDALAADGRHLGGLIVPGLDMMVAALASRAPGIELDGDQQQEVSLLGRDTASAVQGGTLYTAVALVDRVFNDIAHELGATTVKIITGGDAERVRPLLSSQPEYVPDLVLKGLKVYADEVACVT